MNYEALLTESDKRNLIIKEKSLLANDGCIKGKRIAIRKDMSMIQKACVLAEELGHYETSVGNILNQSSTNNKKQEYKARAWAYKEMIAPSDLFSAFKSGCRNRYEIAEHIGVTEEFLEEALSYFVTQYPNGYKNRIEHYMIQFIPNLKIITLFD